MIGWAIFLGVILLVGFTRLRLRLVSDENGVEASVRIGPFRMRVFPARPRKAKEKPRAERPAEKKEPSKPKKRRDLGIRIDGESVRALAGLLKKTLRRALRLLRFERIVLHLTSGGEDAAKVAIHYGRLNRIVYTAYPLVKKLLRIKRTEIRIASDYSLEKSVYHGRIHVSVSIGRAVVFGVQCLLAAVGFYLKFRKTTEREETLDGKRQAQAG